MRERGAFDNLMGIVRSLSIQPTENFECKRTRLCQQTLNYYSFFSVDRYPGKTLEGLLRFSAFQLNLKSESFEPEIASSIPRKQNFSNTMNNKA